MSIADKGTVGLIPVTRIGYTTDGLMLKEEKVYVPKDEVLRVEIIRLHHDTPVGGH